MKLRLATLTGRNVVPLLPDLARLCTVVFRDWPHLYDGDGRYDADHLQALAASPRSALIVAFDGETPVGASTCLPLMDATANIRAPFLARAWTGSSIWPKSSLVLPPIMALSASLSASALAGGVAVYWLPGTATPIPTPLFESLWT
jgi:hypothetical protein